MARIDLGFTDDGDLVRGTPKSDADGNLLYKQPDGSVTKEQREDGVLIYDLALGLGYEVEKTIIQNRLKTEDPDWFHHANIGANLSDLIGEKNTKETAERGVAMIMKSLTYAGLYKAGDINIRPVPVSLNEIVFFINIFDKQESRFYIPLVFDLSTGVCNIYEKEEA